MRVEVIMPTMGESIVEGTVVQWLKAVGDHVDRDEDVFTISTDKVDAEIPSPVAGVLVEILAGVGDTVEVGKVVAYVETDAAVAAAGAAPAAAPTPPAAPPAPVAAPAPPSVVAAPPAVPAPPAVVAAPPAPPAPPAGPIGTRSVDELRKSRSTPLVRKMAEEAGIHDISAIPATGVSGRVTKKDIEAFIAGGGAAVASASAVVTPAAVAAPPAAPAKLAVAAPARPAIAADGSLPKGYDYALVKTPRVHVYAADRVEPMSRMRASIAENMLQARRGTAHCHTVWEADMTRVLRLRKKLKADYDARGVNLTLTAFFVSAVIEGLRQYPLMNAAIDGTNIVYRGNMNIGVASAVAEGLIVPVLKGADGLNLLGVARAVNDIAARSKAGKLVPEDVADGTFTVSNAGVWGALFGIPILVQPQVGILGIGGLKKRVIADEADNIRIRHFVNMCLTFDHRLIDGATADGFMGAVVKKLESFSE
jgi:2-oxoglutarate dehydrogenase E2 component (dihydrolipoamide succinyltransferase)